MKRAGLAKEEERHFTEGGNANFPIQLGLSYKK